MLHRAPTVLVADDLADTLLVLEDMLSPKYNVHTVSNGREALEYFASGGRPDIVLLDVMMPDVDGFDVCREIKSSKQTADVPVLFISSLESETDEAFALALGAADFIHKPFAPAIVLARVGNHLAMAQARRDLMLRNEDLEKVVDERTREIVKKGQLLIMAQGATIRALCSLAETRDSETGNHIRRTQEYVRVLAEHLKDNPCFANTLTEENIQIFQKTAPLHDIGKVAIPDRILLKPGKLTEDELCIMKRHCEFGREALAQAVHESPEASDFLLHAMDIAYCHHEKWDGKGYPRQLKGDEIPLSARLMAVADVYDALRTKRVYKEPVSHSDASAMIVSESGKHFDPRVIEAFIYLDSVFDEIARRYSDEEAALPQSLIGLQREMNFV